MDGYEALDRYLIRLADIPRDELPRTRQVFRPVALRRGEVLFRAGEPADKVAFVTRGLLALWYSAADGRERALGFRAEDELVCAYGAVLRGSPAHATAEALEDSTLLVASRPAFDRLCAGHPSWGRALARLTDRLYLQQEERQRALLLDDAETRYRDFLNAYPHLGGRLTQRQIASFVGVTPVALSRIRSRMAMNLG
ncbi:Crp/Fnr family transcriptional regulator [Actinomadura logoneensis]|uniref:Crp/Fnr family transcriptional regulator n=1 Tax=Actinomadura logoneensis TaxID=2293572 RepID=A0A372JJ17_9ACTN|nr:Crp/Fnr family transcriptional regulator [Actinomadura logoneensis]RFU40012.1 Crp/Fnr family transcriptional regulator [Actinomadura logoneensis]